jgi:PAS domain-containing protein
MQISEGYATFFFNDTATTEIARSEWLASVHPVDRVRLEELRTRTLRNRAQEYSIDYRVLRPGGEVRWIDVRIFVSYFGDGRPRRIVGVDIDIKEESKDSSQGWRWLARGN